MRAGFSDSLLMESGKKKIIALHLGNLIDTTLTKKSKLPDHVTLRPVPIIEYDGKGITPL